MLDFPASPTVGQIFNNQWRWDGVKWGGYAPAATPTVTSFNTRTGAVTLAGADVTSAGGALLASPTFTGTPAAPTAAPGTNTTQLATTAFVRSASSPPPALPPLLSNSTTYLTSEVVNVSSATYAGVANGFSLFPFFVPVQRTFTSYAFYGSVTGGDVYRIGIYNSDPIAGTPTSVAWDSGNISISAGGVKTGSLSVTLNAGNYWLAVWSQAGGAGISGVVGSYGRMNMATISGSTPVPYRNISWANKTFGAPFPDLTNDTAWSPLSTSTAIPLVGFR